LVHSRFLPCPGEDSQVDNFPHFTAETFTEVELHRIRRDLQHRNHNGVFLFPQRSSKFPSPKFPESATTSEISIVVKQERDLRIYGHLAIVLPMAKGLANSLVIMKVKPSFGSFLHVYTNSSETRHLRSFEGESFLPNFPTRINLEIVLEILEIV
jgi:hypothetical protein